MLTHRSPVSLGVRRYTTDGSARSFDSSLNAVVVSTARNTVSLTYPSLQARSWGQNPDYS